MPAARATITITVVGGALVYTITGDGIPVTAKKHRVKKRTQVEWICPDGALAIIFAANPFTPSQTLLLTRQNVSTGFKTTKNLKKNYKYAVVVARPGNPDLLGEDPDLDVSDDQGGGRNKSKRKPAKKKSAPKKKKK